jgi:hypothetical protein
MTNVVVPPRMVPSRYPVASTILLTRFVRFVSLQICKIGKFASDFAQLLFHLVTAVVLRDARSARF